MSTRFLKPKSTLRTKKYVNVEALARKFADIEAIPYRRRKYERQAMMEQVDRHACAHRTRYDLVRVRSLQIMVRAGEQYQEQLKQIDKSRGKQRRHRVHSTAVQGLWFMEEEQLEATASRWHSKYAIRVLMLVMLVPLCLSRAQNTREEAGLAF